MPTQDDMDTGDCCMVRHAQAKPPWTCDCPCHKVTYPNSELDQLIEKEDIRSKYLLLRHAFTKLAKGWHMINLYEHNDSFEDCKNAICLAANDILKQTKI